MRAASSVSSIRYCCATLALMLVCCGAPASAGILYDNGTGGSPPIFSGLNILDYFAVTDSFTITAPSTVTEVEFWTLVFPGSTPVTVDWLITPDPFSGSTLASGTANLNYTFLVNPGGDYYDFGSDIFSVPNVQLAPGTYWLQLENGTSTGGVACCGDSNPLSTVYWDVDNGPSQAYQAYGAFSLGSQSSEAFEVFGTTDTTTPEPSGLVLLGSATVVLLGCRRVLATRLSL